MMLEIDGRLYEYSPVVRDWASDLPLQRGRYIRLVPRTPLGAELVWHSNERYQLIPHKKEETA
jgi:hypothetical protein